MIEYDRRLIGDKLEEIAPIMRTKFENCSSEHEKIEWTRQELIKYFEKKEAVTAFAIIDCFTGITGISGKNLGLRQADNPYYRSIEEIVTEDLDCGDIFCLVIGEANAVHLFN